MQGRKNPKIGIKIHVTWKKVKEYPHGFALWINSMGVRECFPTGEKPTERWFQEDINGL